MNDQLLVELNSKVDKLVALNVVSLKMAEKAATVSIRSFDMMIAQSGINLNDMDEDERAIIEPVLEMKKMLVDTIDEFKAVLLA